MHRHFNNSHSFAVGLVTSNERIFLKIKIIISIRLVHSLSQNQQRAISCSLLLHFDLEYLLKANVKDLVLRGVLLEGEV